MAICLKTIRVDKRVFLGEKKDDRETERRGRRGRPRETEGERSARFCLMFMDMSSENTILLWRGSMLSLSLFLTNPLYMHDIAKLASLLFDTFWFSLPLCIFHQIKPPVLSQSCSSAFHLPLTVWHSIVIDSKCIFEFSVGEVFPVYMCYMELIQSTSWKTGQLSAQWTTTIISNHNEYFQWVSQKKKRQENEENIIIKYRLDTQTILKLNCSNSRSSTAAKLAKKFLSGF